MLTASVYVCVQILIEELEEYEVSLGTPLYRCVYFFFVDAAHLVAIYTSFICCFAAAL